MLILLLAALLSDCACQSDKWKAYTLFEEEVTWHEAVQRCQLAGGTLATISEISTIPDLALEDAQIRDDLFWIGLSFTNGVWQWLDDDTQTWTNFAPQNNTSIHHNCTTVNRQSPFLWVSAPCEELRPFLCQRIQASGCTYHQYRRSSIVTHNDFVITSTEEEDCRRLCDKTTEFECLSFEYNMHNRYCQLSKGNRWIYAEYYAYWDPLWDYFHRICISSSLNGEGVWSDTLVTSTAFTTISAVQQPVTKEPVEVISIKPRTFLLYRDRLPWSEAQSVCERDGGTLATITDVSTMPDLSLQSLNVTERFWVGLRQNDVALWIWTDGNETSWTNWRYTPGFRDLSMCAVVELTNEYWWYTAACDAEWPFICEFEGENCSYTLINHASILANNRLFTVNRTVEECMTICEAQESFVCRSFEYSALTGTCQYSDVNMWLVPNYFRINDIDWDYYHRKCSHGAVWKPKPTTTTTPTTFSTTSSSSSTSTTTSTTTTTEATTTTTIPTTSSTTDIVTTEPYTTVVTTRLVTLCREMEITTSDAPRTGPTTTAASIEKITQELASIGTEVKQKRRILTKISVKDDRPTAKGAGVVASIIIAVVLGGIVLLDIPTVVSQIRNNCRRTEKKKGPAKWNKLTSNDIASRFRDVQPVFSNIASSNVCDTETANLASIDVHIQNNKCTNASKTRYRTVISIGSDANIDILEEKQD